MQKDRKTIFFIDDDIDDLELFNEAVNIIDKEIICISCDDSEATLNALRNKELLQPDLIFLDLNMPRLDGRKFLSEIKSMERYAQIPVIIFSTSSLATDVNETQRLGASYFITKPNTLGELVDILSDILKKDWINMHDKFSMV